MFSVFVEMFTDVDEITIFNFIKKIKIILFQIQTLIEYAVSPFKHFYITTSFYSRKLVRKYNVQEAEQ